MALWQDLLQLQTPFDINLVVKDLPQGQLAEAQITKFDAQGHPNSGTLLIDDDANGLGWFLDPTPFENGEFNQSLSDSAQTHFSEILERVSQDSEGVMIIQENKSFVLIAQDELEALIETTELLKDPTLLADIEKARREYFQGDVLTMDQVFGEGMKPFKILFSKQAQKDIALLTSKQKEKLQSLIKGVALP